MNGLGGYCQRLFEIGDDGRLEKMVILWELGMGFWFWERGWVWRVYVFRSSTSFRLHALHRLQTASRMPRR